MVGMYLTNRQKVLLGVVDELDREGKSSRFMIEKNLFLLKEEEDVGTVVKFYNFFPYRYGPFSNSSFNDMLTLRSKKLLNENEKKPGLTPIGKSTLNNLDFHIKQKVSKTVKRFGSSEQIKLYVYNNYPWYTINSGTPKIKVEPKQPGILTLGYEGHDIDNFLNMLLKERIQVLVDVRYNPFSMNFSFTKGKLKNYLEKVGIEYLHVPELGIRGELRKNLNTKEDYKALFETYKKSTIEKKGVGLKKIIALGKNKRIALMCFEQSKEMCHRGVISEYLEASGVEVIHL